MVESARVIEMRSTSPAAPSGDGAPDEPVLFVGEAAWWDTSGLAECLRTGGWSWITAVDPARATWLASIQKVSLVVIGGHAAQRWAAVREIRAVTAVPIAVVVDHPDEVVALVDVGVDAVVEAGHPASVNFARLRALLRRADHRWGPGVRYLHSHDLVVDLWTQECRLGGRPLFLSPTEYALLTFLMTRPEVALATTTIVCKVWGWMPSDGKNALRIIVNRLRRKLGDDPRQPRFVASVRGIGYRFAGNVTEVADTPEHAGRADGAPLLDAVTRLADAASRATDGAAVSELLLDELVRSGHADGMAVFRVDGARMSLVASRHMSDRWVERVSAGVPLDPAFASAQSVLSGETVQFADVRALTGNFPATVRQLADDEYRACHFVPIVVAGVVWGHVGLVRRACQPLDEVAMAFLRSLCGVVALALPR